MNDLVSDIAISSLPQPVRDAVLRLSAPGSTADGFYAAARKLRTAGAPTQAHAVLDLLASKFGLVDDIRLQLELTQTLAAEGRCDEALALVGEVKRRYPLNVQAFRIQSAILVAMGRYREAADVVRATPLIAAAGATNEDTVYRGIRLAIYLATVGGQPRFAEPPDVAPLEHAVVCMMIRDEADIVAQNLRHHYRMGLRKFVILLNCCRDATASLVEQFQAAHPDAIVCTMVDPVEGYYQAGKTQAAVDFASSYFAAVRRPVTWCMVLDADEFITIDHGRQLADLITAAESNDKDFIAFHLCNATSADNVGLLPEHDIYQHFDVVCGCEVPVVTKNAFRLDLNARITMGNHILSYPRISLDRCLVAAEFGARLVHLPFRSIAQMKTKTVNGGTAYQASDLDENLGAHWRILYRQFVEQGSIVLERQMADYHRRTLNATTRQTPFFFSKSDAEITVRCKPGEQFGALVG